jgi:polysaccharide biosynthesis transport protein
MDSSLPIAHSATNAPIPMKREPEFEGGAVPLAHYIWLMRRHMWRILAFVLACTTLAIVLSSRATPIYESTATVDIDRRTPTGVVGQDAAPSLFNDADQFLATQVRLVQSDSVLRPVSLKYGLLQREEERQNRPRDDDPLAAETPIELKQLRVSRPTNTYLIRVSYRSSDRKLAADVANSIAHSYMQHTYEIRYSAAAGLSQFMERQLEELQAEMEQSSNALASFERELNIINPEEKTSILAARLLELNSEFTRSQSDRVSKEAAFHSMRTGKLAAAKVSSQGQSLEGISNDLADAKQRFAKVRVHFGPNHPEYKIAQAQVEELTSLLADGAEDIGERVKIEYEEAVDREVMLSRVLQQTKREFDNLNARSFEYRALKREAEGDKKLYEELLRRIKEATINSSFQSNAARIADPARPGSEPIYPRTKLNAFLAFMVSFILATGLAVANDALDNTIRDPEQVSRALNTQVVGSLPQIKRWRGALVPVQQPTLPSPTDGQPASGRTRLTNYEEAIRTLRNSILLSEFDRQLSSILVTSASPSEGKSTIAVHLAVAHAQQHHRTLLVDGDLRRPSVHKRFAFSNAHGLSDVLVDGFKWRDAILTPDDLPDLHILPAGTASSRRAADHLGRSLPQILEEAAGEYNLVIVDAPPLLGFPEPLQMAATVDGVLIVARAGETSRKGVSAVVATLRRIRANVLGVVLNEVHNKISDSYYYYGYYGKYYKHYHERKEA